MFFHYFELNLHMKLTAIKKNSTINNLSYKESDKINKTLLKII